MSDQSRSSREGGRLTYAELARLLGEGSYEPITQAYLRAREDQARVDPQTVVTLLQDLSTALGLELSPAYQAFEQQGEEEITLEQFCEGVRRYCEAAEDSRPREGQDQDWGDLDEAESKPRRQESSEGSENHAKRSSSYRSPALSPGISPLADKTRTRLRSKKPQLEVSMAEHDPTIVAQTVVEICNFNASEDQFQTLTMALAEAFPLAAAERSGEENYTDLERVVCGWVETANVVFNEEPAEDPLTAKLKESIAEFERMKSEKEAAGEDIAMLDTVLKTLKQQLNKVIKDSGVDAKARKLQQFQERCAKTIKELFRFYSNQLRMLGKTPSFDSIQKNSSTWNISKFVCFCRDFGLLLDKQRKVGVKTLELATVKNIFIKNAVLQKEMDEGQFEQSLDQLAVAYYDKEYDNFTGAQVSDKPLPEKREILYRFLMFDQTQECLRKAKGFGVPFSSNTDNRMPENDLMKKYKYKPNPRQKASLEEWRMQRSQAPKDFSAPREYTPPKRAPSDAIVSYSSQPAGENHTQSKYASKARNPYTWKTLGELNPEEVLGKEEDFDFNNLIAEDSSDDDEILKKQYPLIASQPVVVEPPQPKEKLLKPKFSTPQLGGVKANALIKSESKPNLEQRTRQMMQKDVSEVRLGKQEMDKALRVGGAQRERGNKVLGRLRQSQQFAS